MTMTGSIVIVGGGIGGLTAALALLDRGVPCEVHERAPELREIGAGLGVWPIALRVFDRLGLGAEVRALGARLAPAGMRGADGRWFARLEESDFVRSFGEPSIGVHRGELQALLLSRLPADVVHTGHEIVSLHQGAAVEVGFANGERAVGSAVVGADGNRSTVRSILFGDRPLHDCRYGGWRGTTTWPDGLTTEEAAGEVWGPRARFGFVPIGGDRLTWYGSARDVAPERGIEAAVEVFASFPDPIPEVVASTPPDMLWASHIYDRRPLRRWTVDRVTLLGDAAHPMTPELGQGACQAIVDAWTLAEELSRAEDPASAFRAYERRRRGRAAMVQIAARGMAVGGNVESPLAQRIRAGVTKSTPKGLVLRQLRLIAD